jgi:antitoxin component YwqK of YwqJK toxin-antitoxin module
MKNCLIIIISLFILIGCKQDINDKSKRNGDWAWWVDAKTGKGQWIRGGNETTVKDGIYTLFYPNGNIYEEGKKIDGKDVDTIFKHDINGVLNEYNFINPKKPCHYYLDGTDTIYSYILHDGIYKSYYSDGAISENGFSKNHLLYGLLTAYYPDGKVRFLRNNIKDSAWKKDYYEDGQIKDSGFAFHNDEIFYIYKSWYENGVPEQEVEWKNGIQDGIMKVYYENNGKLKSKSTWKNNIKDGVVLIYYENGFLKDSFNMVNGVAEGIEKTWYEDGKLDLIAFVQKGKVILEKKYDEDGILVRDTAYVNRIQQ